MAKGKGVPPTRTCVSCGAKRPKSELVRFVLGENAEPVKDEEGTAIGRGAYRCRTGTCLMRPAKEGRLAKALRPRKGF